jgi:hypothetical protein
MRTYSKDCPFQPDSGDAIDLLKGFTEFFLSRREHPLLERVEDMPRRAALHRVDERKAELVTIRAVELDEMTEFRGR